MASERRRPRVLLGAALLAASVVTLGGCSAVEQHKPSDPGAGELPKRSPPTAADFAAVHNARVAGLAKLWTRATVRIHGVDAEGAKVDEQVDGRLILEMPDHLHMRISKLGEPYFLLGSNGTKFWWFDLSKEDRTAFVGLHAAATREQVQRFGLPVHPLDLIELLAISPIPPAAPKDPATRTRWVSATEAEIELPARWGVEIIRFNAATKQPTSVRLTDERGVVVVRSELSEFDAVPFFAGPGQAPKFERRVVLHLSEDAKAAPGGPRLTVTLDLEFPEEPKRINPELFDLEAQRKQQDIRTVKPLGAAPAGGASK